MMKQTLLVICVILLNIVGSAQEKSKAKFGDITEKDFATKVYAVDSNANAVVIADIGTSVIEGNVKGWFSLNFKHYRRVHILNKNGYDVANISVALFTNGNDEEKLDKLKAVTYNLENGKVIETKLDVKGNVFKDKVNRNWMVKKFTFPNIKEGSIIEFEYTKTSDFIGNLEPWEFQGQYPRIWSEYNVGIPEFLGYVFLTQGYKAYDIRDKKTYTNSYRVVDSRGAGASDFINLTSGVSEHHWVIKNVPALKEVSFTSSIDNHITKVQFQLSEYREPLVYRNIMGSWQKVAEQLMNSESFGQQLTKDNGWMNDILKPVLNGAGSPIEKAKKIFAYIRDNYTCTDHSDKFLDQSIKSLTKTKKGTVAEINLLLTAMLKHEDIEADPVMLSTRAHGFTYPLYPLMERFNYVVSRAIIEENEYYLDASEPRLGFGKLPLRCYNGHARVINKKIMAVELTTDFVAEKKQTTVFIGNDEKGNIFGSMQQVPGYYESYTLRDKIKEKGKDELQKEIAKDFGSDIVISKFEIDSLDNFESSLGIKYEFDMPTEKENIIYITPMFGEGYKENPFKSAERVYPVEMPFTMDETFTLAMEVPKGYKVDEIPKSIVVKLNEQNEGFFEYRISVSGDQISLRSRIKIDRANFVPDEYEMLREFFNMVVAKQAEQIVFKKK